MLATRKLAVLALGLASAAMAAEMRAQSHSRAERGTSGFISGRCVRAPAQREALARLVRNVDDVEAVIDELVVKPR